MQRILELTDSDVLLEVLRRHGWASGQFANTPHVSALVSDLVYVKEEEGNYNSGDCFGENPLIIKALPEDIGELPAGRAILKAEPCP